MALTSTSRHPSPNSADRSDAHRKYVGEGDRRRHDQIEIVRRRKTPAVTDSIACDSIKAQARNIVAVMR